MENFIGKRKPTIGISLFSSDKAKSPRDFENGVVGLGIVAAMTESDKVHEAFVSSKVVSPRSSSIPIVSSAKPAANFKSGVNFNGRCSSLVRSGGVFSTSPMSFGVAERGFCAAEFLSSCFLCFKQLHGLDIFMYRGEKAFCSVECRAKHIRGANRREKCGLEVMKDYSSSPYSVAGPHALATGVVAA